MFSHQILKAHNFICQHSNIYFFYFISHKILKAHSFICQHFNIYFFISFLELQILLNCVSLNALEIIFFLDKTTQY